MLHHASVEIFGTVSHECSRTWEPNITRRIYHRTSPQQPRKTTQPPSKPPVPPTEPPKITPNQTNLTKSPNHIPPNNHAYSAFSNAHFYKTNAFLPRILPNLAGCAFVYVNIYMTLNLQGYNYEFLDLSDIDENERQQLKQTLSEGTLDFLQLPWTSQKNTDEWRKGTHGESMRNCTKFLELG